MLLGGCVARLTVVIGVRATGGKRNRDPAAGEDDQREESNDPALSSKAGAISLSTKAALLLPVTV